MLRSACIAALFSLGLGGHAAAQAPDSTYTAIEDCRERDGPESAPLFFECEAMGEWRVFLGASDHSSRLAFGQRGVETQFEQSPLTRGLFQNVGDVLEWRGLSRGEWFAPYATISRWRAVTQQYDQETGEFTDQVRRDQEFLVVAALRSDGPVSACHVAYIDAAQLASANLIARQIADNRASVFMCGRDEVLRINASNAEAYSR
ncbi:MAG: hypothetical protein AAFX09_13850 [Pseudomonadota bacterium]